MQLFNQLVVRTLPFVPKGVVRRFASRYVAGETLAQALDVIRRLNAVCSELTLDEPSENRMLRMFQAS